MIKQMQEGGEYKLNEPFNDEHFDIINKEVFPKIMNDHVKGLKFKPNN